MDQETPLTVDALRAILAQPVADGLRSGATRKDHEEDFRRKHNNYASFRRGIGSDMPFPRQPRWRPTPVGGARKRRVVDTAAVNTLRMPSRC